MKSTLVIIVNVILIGRVSSQMCCSRILLRSRDTFATAHPDQLGEYIVNGNDGTRPGYLHATNNENGSPISVLDFNAGVNSWIISDQSGQTAFVHDMAICPQDIANLWWVDSLGIPDTSLSLTCLGSSSTQMTTTPMLTEPSFTTANSPTMIIGASTTPETTTTDIITQPSVASTTTPEEATTSTSSMDITTTTNSFMTASTNSETSTATTGSTTSEPSMSSSETTTDMITNPSMASTTTSEEATTFTSSVDITTTTNSFMTASTNSETSTATTESTTSEPSTSSSKATITTSSVDGCCQKLNLTSLSSEPFATFHGDQLGVYILTEEGDGYQHQNGLENTYLSYNGASDLWEISSLFGGRSAWARDSAVCPEDIYEFVLWIVDDTLPDPTLAFKCMNN